MAVAVIPTAVIVRVNQGRSSNMTIKELPINNDTNVVFDKIVKRLDDVEDTKTVEFTLSESKYGLVSGVFIENLADRKNPIAVPVSYVDGNEIVVFAPVALTFIEDLEHVNIVLLVPSQGTADDVSEPCIAKLRVKFKCFKNKDMPNFEPGTPRRFAHFEVVGGYNHTELDAMKKAIDVRIEAQGIMPGTMTFEA
tara:strand:+ start:263 stop:847 length:585 start_codon:yes stop_codon:yes gene_type:complete